MDPREGTALAGVRAAHDRREWGAARSGFLEAQTQAPLDGPDLERLAWACRWSDDSPGFLNALERAEVVYLEEGDRTGSARMALEQARYHKQMLDHAVSVTSYLRALEHLEGEPPSAEHAQALWSLGFLHLEAGQPDQAREALEEARDIAHQVGSAGVEALAVQGLAHLAVLEGSPAEALVLTDAAAALAMRPNVAPIHAGHVYCSVISLCRALCDWRRATEWTQVSTRYCERESISGYTGLCRFHQGEIDRLHGHLERAEQQVLQACAELLEVNRYSAGWGYSELVEIRVRRGDLDGAEEALARAVELGSDGQPGRGRLLLARGAPEAARRSLERTLADTGMLAREFRVFVLPVHVTAALAVGDDAAASRSVDELQDLADRLATDGPAAAAAVARGELELHRGSVSAAIESLGAGIRRWCEVEAPYEAAQARVLLAVALREDGDEAASRLELKAARQTFGQIGAAIDVELSLERSTRPSRRTERAFLFSDIVDSTRLAEAMGDAAWEPSLRWHDRTLRTIFASHAGEEIKHRGDGFFVSFLDSDDAVGCAIAIQRALSEHRDGHGFSPAVRIGIHAGEATERDGDYFGSAVTRAARIADSATSSEILISADLLERCRAEVPTTGRRTVDLKGLPEPVEVHAVDWR